MIGTVKRTWPGPNRVTIIVEDQADGKQRMCYVLLPEGQWTAALCEGAWTNGHPEKATPLVFTLEPKTKWGYKIIEAELLPETRNAKPVLHDAPENGPCMTMQGDGESYTDAFERLYGHAGQSARRVFD